MRRAKIIIACPVLIMLGVFAPTLHAQVEGRVLRVGLFAGAYPIVRSGNWSFVEVDLRWAGEQAFEGELRVDQPDRDGDVVTFVHPVNLAPNDQWRPYQVYFVPHDVGNNDRLRVKLFNKRGQLVKMLNKDGEEVTELVSASIYDLSAEEFLVVDLTVPRKLAHAVWLDSDRVGKSGQVNARKVRGMSPQELPSRWHGLEAVDAIIWDNADPSPLSQQQVDALVDWVKAGGQLLIVAGTNWQALASSPLAEVLPVTITNIRQVREAQEFLEIVNEDEYEVRLDRHYSKNPITRCQMSPMPIALPIPADCPNPQIAYRRLLGRGLMTFVGASLEELLPVPSRAASEGPDSGQPDSPGGGPFGGAGEVEPAEDPFVRICESVVGRNLLALADVWEQQDGLRGMFSSTDLFREVRRSIGFGSLSAMFLVFAILFAIAYTLAATVGSYWYLKSRSWQHQCWTVFALVAIAGSVIGTGMVWALRGVTTKVWQTTVVDGHSGLDYGYATCMFGVKTPDHTRLELCLPVGSEEHMVGRRFGPLRAMPEVTSLEEIGSRFVAPEDYRFDVLHSRLIGVPVRATLKEFQGFWHGPLGGTLDAKLVARNTSHPAVQYEFAEGSYIRNNLGVDLRDCYILETDRPDEMALHSFSVHCFHVGQLPKSGPGSALEGEQVRRALFYEKEPDAGPNDRPTRIEKWPRLDEKIKGWIDALSLVLGSGGARLPGGRLSADQEEASLLLLSVFDLVGGDPQKQRTLRRSHGRAMDCTHQITNRTAVLIGWSDDPPPAAIEIDQTNYPPDKSRTMYRFVIPVERH